MADLPRVDGTRQHDGLAAGMQRIIDSADFDGERTMPRRGRYPDAVRREAIRLVHERAGEFRSQWEAICAVAEQLGPSAETVRGWVRREELQRQAVGDELHPSSSIEQRRIAELEREIRELRRDNEILKAAFALFARDHDVQPPD